MTAPTNKHEQTAARHPFFRSASPEEAASLFQTCTWHAYNKGEKILYAQSSREGLLLLVEGVAEVCVNTGPSRQEEVLEVLEAGDMLGFSSLADFLGEPNDHESSHTVEVLASEHSVCLMIPYDVLERRWHDEDVRDYMMRQVSVRLREIYASLAEQVKLSRQWGESDAFIRRVQDLMSPVPVTMPEETSVQLLAARMMEEGISSILITDRQGDTAGIITEKDIVSRYVAAGASESTEAGDIMTPDPVTVPRTAYYYEALSTFLVHGVKHLPVTDGRKPVGMVTLSDLLRKKNRGTFDILQEIEQADEDSLPEVRHAIYGALGKLLEDRIPIVYTLEVVTSLYDRLARQCIHLALQNTGNPPAAFAFFMMGSSGRGEQFLLSDQDHFLVYQASPDNDPDDTDAYFGALGEEITRLMEHAGYKRCDGDMMASFPQWRGSIRRWSERLRSWSLRATGDNILLAQNFLSHRFLYGDEALRDRFNQTVKEQLRQSSILLYRAAQEEKQQPVPSLDHPIRALFRMKKDHINIKKQALFPFYHSLQLLSAHHQFVEGTPRQQIAFLQDQRVLSAETADELQFAYEVMLSIRVHQSWARYQRGEESSSDILFSHMKTREKEELMLALKSVRSLQNNMLAEFGIQ
ncbi:DUF294 nucleotidyltransferase-like domain-containing protein [Alkalicoccus chagannorensis]|uniref:DUF294 nucleotidyltransferase-like domain-containing protein n=1 Tax=Alkalicoccus chagannorensis TaxID=427072 RepID=UPI0004284558|nr:DUF294 nucleotidyltransferase-like domain-containing protein [Alkalicoccus chagannorensis]